MTALWVTVELSVGVVVRSSVIEPLRLEALSPPPGGEVVFSEGPLGLRLELGSDEPSTVRAMWNSYMGLVSAALRTAA